MSLTSYEWAQKHAPAMQYAITGDSIFKEVNRGAEKLDAAWEKQASSWKRLMDQAVSGGYFGLAPNIVDARWLYWVLFQPAKFWPGGLSREEKALLKLAVAVAKYHPLYNQGVKFDRKWGLAYDPENPAPESKTLKAMQRYAKLFKQKVAKQMLRTYRQEANEGAKRILPLCLELYNSPCTHEEAVRMFLGDLQRGWKASTMEGSPAMYRVLPAFVDWLETR